MAYTETTTTTYGQRLKNSGKGIMAGLLMFVIGTGLLWWNEGRTVKEKRALNQTEKVCVEMDPATYDASFEGKTIHATGIASTEDVLVDDFCGASANAVAISRNVEYYQWVEHASTTTKDKVGGGQETTTTYTYTKEWTYAPVDSDSFKDPEYIGRNSVRTTVNGTTQRASNVAFGAYRLSDRQIASFSCNEAMDLSAISGNFSDSLNNVKVEGNVIYYGNSAAPEVGDVRVTFKKSAASAQISIVADVEGDSFTDHVAKNGNSVQLVNMGEKSAEEMFETAQQGNKIIGWILRVIGILLVVGGLKGIVGIVIAILKVLPFLANIVNVGTSLICWIVGLAWSFLVIAIAWIAYRPVIGIALLVAVGALVFFLVKKSKDAKAAAPAPTPEA